jgi:hypothetical protein
MSRLWKRMNGSISLTDEGESYFLPCFSVKLVRSLRIRAPSMLPLRPRYMRRIPSRCRKMRR